MSLLSEDVGFIFLYILPGFLAFELILKNVGADKEYKEIQTIMFSFIFSSLIYLPWAWWTNIDDIESFKTTLYSLQNMLGFIVAGWAMGYIVALVYNQIVQPDHLMKPVWVTAFTEVMPNSSSAIVLTKSGNEFSSEDVYYTEGQELKKQELILMDASMITRNDSFEITEEKKLTCNIYLDNKEITRIIFPIPEDKA